jgi:alpha-amylase/alpha-mannosidase (GH57 family)
MCWIRRAFSLVWVCLVVLSAAASEKAPLQLAIVWHQHQPMYWNRLTDEYELPWARIHGVQEYIDSARISKEFPEVQVTFNLQPSLLWQLQDIATVKPDKRSQGDLYEHIGAMDNHLHWTWALATDPCSLSEDDRAAAQEQFFWINGYMFDDDTDDLYYDAYYTELRETAGSVGLTDAQLLDAAGLFLLWQISPELHEEYDLEAYREHRGFTREEIVTLVKAQTAILQEVVSVYRDLIPLGNELITSPFYHPILPLLVSYGWEEDALAQLAAGQHQHADLFGSPAVGVWAPEQAVSERSVSLLGEAGFVWTSSDQGLLAQALGRTPSMEELTTAYTWDDVVVLFRHTELSNRISFAYGNRPTSVAVDDMLSELRAIWDAIESPADRILTLALDGENWMFMAGYPDNGRGFLRSLYAAIDAAEWIDPVTPASMLAAGLPTVPLKTVPVGSWAGDLSTWSGEPEEDEGWERLAAARPLVTAAGDPPEALDAIHAAQGSDWFWWYGTDHDSGTDDLFDWLFKAHLTGAYSAIGLAPPAVLGLRLIPPTFENLGEANPQIDGQYDASEGWDDAVVLSGTGEIVEARLAYKESTLTLLVDLESDPQSLIGHEDLYLCLYASGRPGVPANVVTRHASVSLGFAVATAMQVRFDRIQTDGSGVVSKFAADGSGGWRYASTIGTAAARAVRVGDRIEFSVPFSEAGIEPGASTTMMLVLERAGEVLATAPQIPVRIAIPTLIQGIERFAMDDPRGDDHGIGSYTYPLSERIPAGSYDLLAYRVFDADDRWQLAFDMATLTNEWGGPHGFSHPILYLYFDISDGGSAQSFEEGEAARVAMDPGHPWNVFVRVTGWPAYGRHLWTAAGEGPMLVEVASDPKRGRIIVTIPKSMLPSIEGWHYILVGSQDGYGANYLRPIAETAGEWIGGGNPNPFWAPQVYDYLAPAGMDQEEILSSYDEAKKQLAALCPVRVELEDHP